MDKVYLFGKKLLENNPEIVKNRKFFQFNVDSKIEEIISSQELDGYLLKVIERNSDTGFEMGWHQDDVAFYRNSKRHCEEHKKDDIKPFCKEKKPIYTMILYYSTQNIDFTGGEFCFIDLRIKPEKGLGILFDSREIHRVLRVRSGERKSKILKFYE